MQDRARLRAYPLVASSKKPTREGIVASLRRGVCADPSPQVRSSPEPYRSKRIEFLAGNPEALEALVAEMPTRELSIRVEDCFRREGGELLITRTATSAITDRLWDDCQAFCGRALSDIDVECLFLDALLRVVAPPRSEGRGGAPGLDRDAIPRTTLRMRPSHGCGRAT